MAVGKNAGAPVVLVGKNAAVAGRAVRNLDEPTDEVVKHFRGTFTFMVFRHDVAGIRQNDASYVTSAKLLIHKVYIANRTHLVTRSMHQQRWTSDGVQGLQRLNPGAIEFNGCSNGLCVVA